MNGLSELNGLLLCKGNGVYSNATVTQPCNWSWEGNGCYDVVKFEALDIRSVYHSTLAALRSKSVTAVFLGLFHTDDPVDGDLPRQRRVTYRITMTARNMSTWRRTCSPYHIWKWTLSTMLEVEDTRRIIAVWAQRELRKKNVTAPYNMWHAKQRVILDCFWRSAQRQSEVSVLECLCTLEEMQETIVCVVYKRDKYEMWTPRERERERGINTQVECLIKHLY